MTAPTRRLTPWIKPEWMTIQQVEVVHNIPARTQYKLIRQGKLKIRKIGKRTQIEVASLEAL